MSVKKTLTEFMVIYEKTQMSKEVDALENDVNGIIERVSVVLADDKAVIESSESIMEGISALKKLLIKHKLYDL